LVRSDMKSSRKYGLNGLEIAELQHYRKV